MILEDKERIQWFAAKYVNTHDMFFMGRGIDYIVFWEDSFNKLTMCWSKKKWISDNDHSTMRIRGRNRPF